MGDYWEHVKAHYRYSGREAKEILISTALVAFMFAFNDGRQEFRAVHWLSNYIGTAILVLSAFVIQTTAQKLWGIAVGYRVRYKMWNYGLAIGAAIAVLSNGSMELMSGLALAIALPGGVQFAVVPRLRMGGFRHGLKHSLTGWISGFGPLMNIFAAMTATFLFGQLLGIESIILDKFVLINFVLAFFMLLPIPPMPGLTMFFGNRMLYVVVFGFLLAYVMLYIMGVYSLIIAFLLAGVIWVSYYILVEHKL